LTKTKTKKLTVAEVIARAGGVAVVSIKLSRSTTTVTQWFYGMRRPGAGPVREALCKMAKCKVDEVEWEAAK
jgi:hypothetical protein